MIILIYLILPWVVSFDRIQLVSAIMRYESMDNRTRYVHLASKSNYLYRIYMYILGARRMEYITRILRSP